jgi:hypothetical protein
MPGEAGGSRAIPFRKTILWPGLSQLHRSSRQPHCRRTNQRVSSDPSLRRAQTIAPTPRLHLGSMRAVPQWFIAARCLTISTSHVSSRFSFQSTFLGPYSRVPGKQSCAPRPKRTRHSLCATNKPHRRFLLFLFSEKASFNASSAAKKPPAYS